MNSVEHEAWTLADRLNDGESFGASVSWLRVLWKAWRYPYDTTRELRGAIGIVHREAYQG